MDPFSRFCNICCKTDNLCLTDVSKEEMKHLLDTLTTFVGHGDILNHNIINLCQLCSEELIRSNNFKEKCFSNFIQLRQSVFDMKSKLEVEGDTCDVQNALQIFLHQEVLQRNNLAKNNCPDSISTENVIVKSTAALSEHRPIFSRQIINLQSAKKECEFVDDCSYVYLTNSAAERDDTQDGNTSEGSVFMEFTKEEYDVKSETDISASEYFGETLSRGHVEEKETIEIFYSGNESMTDELDMKQEKNSPESLELQTINTFGDVASFEIGNVSTIVNMEKCKAKSITQEELAKDYMKTADNSTASNAQPNRPYMQEYRLGSRPTVLNSDVPKCVNPCAGSHQPTNSCSTEHERERPFRCTMCDKAFTQYASLKIHVRIHTGDKPYKCTVCNKAFATSGSRLVHNRTHSGDRPYKCTVCNKSFATSSNRIRHLRTHTGNKPYKCTVCNKAFTTSAYRTIHECLHHSDRPLKCLIRPFELMTHGRTHWR